MWNDTPGKDPDGGPSVSNNNADKAIIYEC